MIGILINIIIGGLVFGYAGFAMYRFVKRSKQGKCASCALNKSCASQCETHTPFSEKLSK